MQRTEITFPAFSKSSGCSTYCKIMVADSLLLNIDLTEGLRLGRVKLQQQLAGEVDQMNTKVTET